MTPTVLFQSAVLAGAGLGGDSMHPSQIATVGASGAGYSSGLVGFSGPGWRNEPLDSKDFVQPNYMMLNILKELEEVRVQVNPMISKTGTDYIREARDGSMFGDDVDE